MFGGNAMHGAINVKSTNIDGNNNLNFQVDKNESARSKFLYKSLENTAVGFELVINSDNRFRNHSDLISKKLF